MAISEACKFEIEESVDKACEEHGISKAEAFRALETFYNKIGVAISFGAVKTKYYRAKETDKRVSNGTTDKPARKHTKPEVREDLKKTAKAIKNGEVSDDDIKELDLAIAKTIDAGKSNTRVGTATAWAVKRKRKESKGGESQRKPIDNFYRLNNTMKSAIDGLTAWADGQMLPTSRDEADYAKAILAKGANFIVQFARLGIDIEGVNEIFVKGEANNENKQHLQHKIESG